MKPKTEYADFLIVCSSSTPGHQRSEFALQEALSDLRYSTVIARPDYRWVKYLQFAHPFLDISQAFCISRAVRRQLKHVRVRAIIYPTSLSVVLEPAKNLAVGAVRFDALAEENRQGVANWPLRLLERRQLRRVRLLLPYTEAATAAAGKYKLPTIELPTPFGPSLASPTSPRSNVAVCYAGNPYKKGLDLAVDAWRRADLGVHWMLHITGVDPVVGRRWLRERNVVVPSGVVWRGPLSHHEHRALTSEAALMIGASRYEDFGIAQIEALADGALLVTVPSSGPYEALRLARELDADTVAVETSAAALAGALRRAALMAHTAAALRYRVSAAKMLDAYTFDRFRVTLQESVVPLLFSGSNPPNATSV